MDWWGWVAWAVALLSGAAGLVLGIRSERRASRYSPQWVMNDRPMGMINRTGEDASNVSVVVTSGGRLPHPSEQRLVKPDEAIEFLWAEPETPGGTMTFAITWTRPQTGKVYRWPRQKR